MDWDDLKFVLAVARHGTYSAAAQALEVNQTTVTRRIDHATEKLGTPLFDRIDGRLLPTATGQAILTHAEKVETEVRQALHTASDLQQTPHGTVRVTAVETLITGLLSPALTQFNRRYPQILLELVASHENLNLSRREADIALRLNRPQGGTAITRKLCDIGFACYEAASGSNDSWLGYDESLDHLPEAQWLRSRFGDQPPLLRSTSVGLLHSATAQGLGCAMLACVYADKDKRLRRLEPDSPSPIRRELWLLTHETARRNPAVRAVSTWIDEVVSASRERLAG